MKNWNQRRFLYINGVLYRKLQTNKSEDLYVAKNTETGKIQTFSYAVVRDVHEIAYNVREVGEMLGRSPRRIRFLISQGVVEPKKQSQNSFKGVQEIDLGDNIIKATNTGRCEYYFTPKQVHELRDHFSRGMKYVQSDKRAVPTKAQLEALMSQSVVLYVKAKDGSFVPTWQAKDF